MTGCIAGFSHDKCSPEAKGKPCPLHCRPDGSNIGNGSVSNADPYSHMTYNAQDMRTNYPSRNATLAHYAYAYDIYVGNSSYLEMELARNYKDTSGKNKVRRCRTCSGIAALQCARGSYSPRGVDHELDNASSQYGWYPYPSTYSFPFICEKPQVLYSCNQALPPPTPPVPLCLPHDNDTGAWQGSSSALRLAARNKPHL